MGLSSHVARLVSGDCAIASIDSNRVVWERGDIPESWDLVISGLVVVSQGNSVSGMRLVHFFGNGAWYGEQNIINSSPTYHRYHTMDQVDLMRMPARLFLGLMRDEPDFARCIAKLGAWKNQLLWDTNSLLKAGTPSLRVVLGLGLCAENLASTALPHLIDTQFDRLKIPLKQQLLAQYCGVSRTIMSKHLQMLQLHGLIKIDYSEVELLMLGHWRGFTAYLKENLCDLGGANLDELMSLFCHYKRATVDNEQRSA